MKIKYIVKYLLIPLMSIVLFFKYYLIINQSVGGIGYSFNKNVFIDLKLELLFFICISFGLFFILKENKYRFIVALLPIVIFYCFYDKYFLSFNNIFNIKLELLLVTCIYYAIFFILKDNIYRYFTPILIIAFFYFFYDFYFLSFGKIFKFCDFSELPELLDVLPFWQIVAYVSFISPLVFILVKNFSRSWFNYTFLFLAIAFVILIILIKPVFYTDFFEKNTKFGVTTWSDVNTAQNGYLATLLYFEAAMNKANKLATELYGDGIEYEKSQAQLIQYLKDKKNPHNIHIIMMESFFNPKLFANINYDNTTYHTNFSKLLKDKESSIISPVFGGFTAEAEFEVLCATPALHKYSSIEFNSFTGEMVYCAPKLLNDIGYRVVATNSYKPSFFNAINAYRGMGFTEIYFPQKYAPKMNTYLTVDEKTQYVFDGDLFYQNLEFVRKHLQSPNSQPLFNYVLGVYGHLPFDIDEQRHPIRIKAQANNKLLNNEFQRASNQIYYRTEALADYLTKLIQLDPNSIIIVMGDHLPKLGGQGFYKKMAYRNNSEDSIHKPPAFYIFNGEFLKKEGLHQYEMMNMIFDYITDNKYCKDRSCKRSNDVLSYQYDMIMARALR